MAACAAKTNAMSLAVALSNTAASYIAAAATTTATEVITQNSSQLSTSQVRATQVSPTNSIAAVTPDANAKVSSHSSSPIATILKPPSTILSTPPTLSSEARRADGLKQQQPASYNTPEPNYYHPEDLSHQFYEHRSKTQRLVRRLLRERLRVGGRTAALITPTTTPSSRKPSSRFTHLNVGKSSQRRLARDGNGKVILPELWDGSLTATTGSCSCPLFSVNVEDFLPTPDDGEEHPDSANDSKQLEEGRNLSCASASSSFSTSSCTAMPSFHALRGDSLQVSRKERQIRLQHQHQIDEVKHAALLNARARRGEEVQEQYSPVLWEPKQPHQLVGEEEADDGSEPLVTPPRSSNANYQDLRRKLAQSSSASQLFSRPPSAIRFDPRTGLPMRTRLTPRSSSSAPHGHSTTSSSNCKDGHPSTSRGRGGFSSRGHRHLLRAEGVTVSWTEEGEHVISI